MDDGHSPHRAWIARISIEELSPRSTSIGSRSCCQLTLPNPSPVFCSTRSIPPPNLTNSIMTRVLSHSGMGVYHRHRGLPPLATSKHNKLFISTRPQLCIGPQVGGNSRSGLFAAQAISEFYLKSQFRNHIWSRPCTYSLNSSSDQG